MKKLNLEELRRKSNHIRKDLIEVSCKNNAGHIASSLSCVDLLVALYYRLLNISKDPQWNERDRLIFSKAHGAYGLYSILSDLGYIERNDWVNFYSESFLMGCIERSTKHGIEAGTGSLGHGLPMAVGVAFGAKLQRKKYKIYCIMGDGELQEGSNWEGIQFAVKHKLSNLIVIVDNNKLQAMDFLENILSHKDCRVELVDKFNAFGFQVNTCDGHNMDDICKSISEMIEKQKMDFGPNVLLAETIKGYGLTCMENIPKYHFRVPTDEELKTGNRYE